ncbi:MAG: hypothetical protein V1870_01745 [Candidatus Aenigmatarchaeota archaeon]
MINWCNVSGILVMSVNTGYQGQKFDERTPKKVKDLYERINDSSNKPRIKPAVYASLLDVPLKDQSELIRRLIHAGIDGLHIDAMKDYISLKPEYGIGPMPEKPGGRYTLDHMGPKSVQQAKETIKEEGRYIPIEVHMMTLYEDILVHDYLDAGAGRIIMHMEANRMPYGRQLDWIANDVINAKRQFYLAFEPDTKVPDNVLSSRTLIAVDGGINSETAKLVTEAGAVSLAVASAITKDWQSANDEELKNRIELLRHSEYPIFK